MFYEVWVNTYSLNAYLNGTLVVSRKKYNIHELRPVIDYIG